MRRVTKRRAAHKRIKRACRPIRSSQRDDAGLAFLEHLLRLERERIPILPEHPPTH